MGEPVAGARSPVVVCLGSPFEEISVLRGSLLTRLEKAGHGVHLLATSPAAATRLRNDPACHWPLHEMTLTATKGPAQRGLFALWKLLSVAREGHQRGRCSAYRETRRRQRETGQLRRAVTRLGAGVPEEWLEACQGTALQRAIGRLGLSTRRWLEALAPSHLMLGVPSLTSAAHTLLPIAREIGCDVVGIDSAWDDLACRPPLPRVSRLMVWSEPMKREAVEWHGYPPNRVEVVGALRCDAYRNELPHMTRGQLMERLGFSTDHRLLTLATNVGDEATYLSIAKSLSRASSEGRFGSPVGLLVRPHPRMALAARESLARLPHVAVEDGFDFAGERAVAPEAVQHLAALLYHSDVVLSVLSALMLESAYYDTPNVSLAYGGLERFYGRAFLEPILASGAFRIADGPEALIDHVTAYLRDPSLDRAARARFRDAFGGAPGPTTAERTVRALRAHRR